MSAANFGRDFAIAIGVAAGVTIAALIVFCVLAHCGPSLCGLGRKDRRWFASDVENQRNPGTESPFIRTFGIHIDDNIEATSRHARSESVADETQTDHGENVDSYNLDVRSY
ncbi:hypothetical protein F5B22DRAFT_651838 [Xylaria bambusicola]|uniref:uncharacterized protein n=1 Tax=Xylaria bambusicola TaxID=326684 RepID=UPI0020077E8E|nr:uncharacterized protein F5B22DRAFT_651838 [Xylaria bambusicola]KAI0505331.1 hypothetical protein F5B22DRAFT_651838 [Xylaria bambusicola]